MMQRFDECRCILAALSCVLLIDAGVVSAYDPR